MNTELLIETIYKPIFLEIEANGIFRTEKQKEKWWDLVNSGINHTTREISRFEKSTTIIGLEILANSCCDECKRMNGKVFKDIESIPVIPFADCSRMKSGKNCNCCFLPAIDWLSNFDESREAQEKRPKWDKSPVRVFFRSATKWVAIFGG